MENEHIRDISALQEKYNWSDFLLNYVQELEVELHNVGIDNKIYFHKRIQYCEEMLKVCGNIEECDRLYSNWLKEDPKWGWGYIGWADCYCFRTNEKEINMEKAEKIISILIRIIPQ